MPTETTELPSVRALLTAAIDYAGLFPPAQLPMADAVARYADYRRGPDAWALGRFVLPAARLGELDEATRAMVDVKEISVPWRLSATVAEPSEVVIAEIAAYNDTHSLSDARFHAVVDTLELRAGDVGSVTDALASLPAWLHAFVELSPDAPLDEILPRLRERGARAKLRTGGLTPDAFPSSAGVAHFLAACGRWGVACKLTAGLHHPLRGDYALTYASDSARGRMFGFVNVLLAAALLRQGGDEAAAVRLLDESRPAAFDFGSDGVRWERTLISTDAIVAAREAMVVSFGSCSFEEPVTELRALTRS